MARATNTTDGAHGIGSGADGGVRELMVERTMVVFVWETGS